MDSIFFEMTAFSILLESLKKLKMVS